MLVSLLAVYCISYVFHVWFSGWVHRAYGRFRNERPDILLQPYYIHLRGVAPVSTVEKRAVSPQPLSVTQLNPPIKTHKGRRVRAKRGLQQQKPRNQYKHA